MVHPVAAAGVRRWVFRASTVAMAVLLSLVVTEAGLHLWYPTEGQIPPDRLAHYQQQAEAARGDLGPDLQLGHAPVLGGRTYDGFGLRRGHGTADGTAARTPGLARILFLGDSVTARGALIEGLRAATGAADTELLNAGVEGWNPAQEVEFYFRHQRALQPDHVVLTLHNNDFSVTPTGLYDGDTLTMCAPGHLVGLSGGLYRWSVLYRMLVQARCAQFRHLWGYLEQQAEVTAALRRLRDDLAREGRRLTVLLVPILVPEPAWDEHERRARRVALAMLADLAIPTVDLLPAVMPLLNAGFDLQQSPGDRWHPNEVGGFVMAAFALERGLREAPAIGLLADERVLPPGEVQHLRIEAGERYAGRRFAVVGSATLAGAGVLFDGQPVPFAIDAYTHRTLDPAQGLLQGGHGLLDARGEARVAVVASARAAGEPIGSGRRTLWHACAVFDQGGTRLEQVSPPVPLLVRE